MSSPPSTSNPVISLNRQQILDEDEYTAALSEIIARDFFPSLVHLDATNSYLDAIKSEDTQRINDTVRRLQDLATPQASTSRSTRYPLETPGRTPYGFGPSDTPGRTPRTNSANKRPRYDTSLSLDSFQAKYTSEDNASFTEILNEENRKRKERWGWAWEAQKRVQNIKAIEMDRRERLLIEDTTSQPPGVKEQLLVEKPEVKLITEGQNLAVEPEEAGDDGTGNSSALQKAPPAANTGDSSMALTKPSKVEGEDNSEVDVMAPKKDTRSAGVDGWSFKTRNALMFGPGADVSPYDDSTSLQTSNPRGPPKEIKHTSTRLPEQSNEDGEALSSAPSSPTRSRVGAAIAGTPYVPREERSEFPLLPSLPSPTPTQLGPAAVNQLMTWGTITSTPRVISSDPDAVPDAPPAAPFHLPPPTPRERIAHKLSSTASRSLREKASLLSGTPGRANSGISLTKGRRLGDKGVLATPRPHPGLLTPAARRLLERTASGGSSTAKRTTVTQQEQSWEGIKGKGRELGDVRWTPTPGPVTRKK